MFHQSFSVIGKAVDVDGLLTELFKNYHKDVRPICDDGSVVNVKIGMALRQVIDLVSTI